MAADVAAYREFLPLVRESEVSNIHKTGDGVTTFSGKLRVAKASLRIDETFVSEVVADKNAMSIVSKASNGPVKSLVNVWKFTDLPAGGSQSELVLEYQVSNFALRMMIAASSGVVMEKLTQAFEKRAEKLYG